MTATVEQDATEHWRIERNAGALTAEILLAGPGPGPLSAPKLPDTQGIDTMRRRCALGVRRPRSSSARAAEISARASAPARSGCLRRS